MQPLGTMYSGYKHISYSTANKTNPHAYQKVPCSVTIAYGHVSSDKYNVSSLNIMVYDYGNH